MPETVIAIIPPEVLKELIPLQKEIKRVLQEGQTRKKRKFEDTLELYRETKSERLLDELLEMIFGS